MSSSRTQSSTFERPSFDEWISKNGGLANGVGVHSAGNDLEIPPEMKRTRRKSSVPVAKSDVNGIRRQSLANSLHIPKSQSQSPQEQTPPSSGRRKWSDRYRLSEGFEFDPLHTPNNNQNGNSNVNNNISNHNKHQGTASSGSSSKSGSTTANDQESRASSTNALFVPLRSEDQKEMVKEAGQLASVLLEMRKNIMSDYNIDLEHNESLDVERDKNIPGQIRLKNISRSTIQRSEKVKVMLNLFYFYIFNSQRTSNAKYAGVDGVFNPLQVIRNRRIRKKYHQPPKLAIKTLPYASTVFSRSKNKLIWQVDLTELTYDFNWRAQHWHELIDPHGELWFPDGHSRHHQSRKHGHGNHHLSHRPHLHPRHHSVDKEISYIHDQLFESDEDLLNSGSNSSKDDLSEMRSRKRDRLASKIRKRSKSPFKRSSNTSKEQLESAFEIENGSGNNSSNNYKVDSSLLNLNSPLTELSNGTSFKGSLLNDITIEPVNAQQRAISSSGTNSDSNDPSSSLVPQGRAVSPSEDFEMEKVKTLNNYLQRLRRLDDLMSFGEHHLSVKDREYHQLINYNKVLKDGQDIRSRSDYLKNEVLIHYENILNDRSKSLETYQSELTNNYSPRVDKLLLLSDRTIGEVNTTLSLEVRKLSERLEKLGPSYKRAGSLVNLAYWLLENLIVFVLWGIWIGFSIGRIIRFFVLLIWKVLKWIFY